MKDTYVARYIYNKLYFKHISRFYLPIVVFHILVALCSVIWWGWWVTTGPSLGMRPSKRLTSSSSALSDPSPSFCFKTSPPPTSLPFLQPIKVKTANSLGDFIWLCVIFLVRLHVLYFKPFIVLLLTFFNELN